MSLYDILGQVAQQWDTLTTNEKDYYLNIQAGANQTVNLASILDNYDHVLEATATAYDSVGSAARENQAAIDSLEGRTKNLSATFEDLANDVIDRDLVKGALSLLTEALELLDTPLGQIITKIALLTGVGWGASALLSASKILPVVIGQFTQFSAIITGSATAIGSLGSIALPVIGIISALAVGGYELYKVWKNANPSIAEAKEEIEGVNSQLKTNEERLKEISQIPWYEYTDEIDAERQAIVKENEELKKRQSLLSKVLSKDGGEGFGITGTKIEYQVTYKTNAAVVKKELFETKEAAEEFANSLHDVVYSSIKEVEVETTLTGEAMEKELLNRIEVLNQKVAESGEWTAELNAEYQNLLPYISDLSDKTEDFVHASNNLIKAHDEAAQKAKFLDSTLSLTKSEVDKLVEIFPELSKSIQQNGNAWGVLKGTVESSVGSMITSNGRLYESDKQRVVETIKLLEQLIQARKAELSANVAGSYADALRLGKQDIYLSALSQVQSLENSLYALKMAQAKAQKLGYEPSGSGTITGGGTGGKTTATKTASQAKTENKQVTDEALKIFQNYYKDLQQQRDLDLIDSETYYAQLEQLVIDYKNDATKYLAAYNYDIKALDRNMYQYEKELYQARTKLAQETARQSQQAMADVIKAEKAMLDKEADAYNALFAMGADVAQDRIDALQKELDLLDEQNEAREESIQLQQLEERLAKAKTQMVRVYKDGKFQYVSDTEAISSAQTDLVEFQHKQILDAEKKRINEQIAYWQEWGNKWGSAVSDYEKKQNELLVLEQFGISKEDANWDKRIKNLQGFVNEYGNLMNQIAQKQEELNQVTSNMQNPDYSIDDYGSSMIEPEPTVELVFGGHTSIDPDYYNDSVDYSIVGPQAIASGASKDYIAELRRQRANKIRIKYGGVDPHPEKAFAGGTTNAPNGLALVGENGPEMRVLNNGDGIIPADITRNLWQWGSVSPMGLISSLGNIFKNQQSNNGQIVSIENINLPSVTNGQEFVDYMRNNFWRTALQTSR